MRDEIEFKCDPEMDQPMLFTPNHKRRLDDTIKMVYEKHETDTDIASEQLTVKEKSPQRSEKKNIMINQTDWFSSSTTKKRKNSSRSKRKNLKKFNLNIAESPRKMFSSAKKKKTVKKWNNLTSRSPVKPMKGERTTTVSLLAQESRYFKKQTRRS